jgi:hypothetical protein
MGGGNMRLSEIKSSLGKGLADFKRRILAGRWDLFYDYLRADVLLERE